MQKQERIKKQNHDLSSRGGSVSGEKTFCLLPSARLGGAAGEAWAFRLSGGGRRAAAGFTLIELLVTLTLVVVALGITFATFYSISTAWQRGQAMADSLNRGEYVMEQIGYGLHSAFFPIKQTGAIAQTNAPVNTNAAVTGAEATVASASDYGFSFEDKGAGPDARDAISWVKTGTALLGTDDPLWRGLHRVRINVEEDPDGRLAVTSRAWRPYGNMLDFNAEDLPPLVISEKVLGLNFRVAKEADTDGGWKWLDDWGADETNRLPLAVEVVLFLDPPENKDEPVEMKRIVEIPVAPFSWSKKDGGR